MSQIIAYGIDTDILDAQLFNGNIFIIKSNGDLLKANFKSLLKRISNLPDTKNDKSDSCGHYLVRKNESSYKNIVFDVFEGITSKIGEISSFPVDSCIVGDSLMIGEEDYVEIFNIGSKNEYSKINEINCISDISKCNDILTISSANNGLYILDLKNNSIRPLFTPSTYTILTSNTITNIDIDNPVQVFQLIELNHLCDTNSLKHSQVIKDIIGNDISCHTKYHNRSYLFAKNREYEIKQFKNEIIINPDFQKNTTKHFQGIQLYTSENNESYKLICHSNYTINLMHDKIIIYSGNLHLPISDDGIIQVRTFPTSRYYKDYILISSTTKLWIIKIENNPDSNLNLSTRQI